MSHRGLARHNAKRDHNELAIVEVLQRRGYHVDRVSAPGFPDLVVSKRAAWTVAVGSPGWCIPLGLAPVEVWFVEIKRPKGPYTAKQIEWRSRWQGPEPHCLRSVEDAIAFPDRVAPANGVPDSNMGISAKSTTRRRRARHDRC